MGSLENGFSMQLNKQKPRKKKKKPNDGRFIVKLIFSDDKCTAGVFTKIKQRRETASTAPPFKKTVKHKANQVFTAGERGAVGGFSSMQMAQRKQLSIIS